MVVLNLVSAGKLCSSHPLNKSFPGYFDIRAPYNGRFLCTRSVRFFFSLDLPIAWDQAPDWVKEKKNEDKLDSEASRAVAWGGERFFFFLLFHTSFFVLPFFLHSCGALSQANLVPQYLQTIDASILNVNNNCFQAFQTLSMWYCVYHLHTETFIILPVFYNI